MSRENVEIVRNAIEAFGREGVDGSLRYYHPEVEWTTSQALVGGGTFRGHQGLRRYFANFDDEFDDLRIEPDKFIDAGEQVIGSVRISGRGRRAAPRRTDPGLGRLAAVRPDLPRPQLPGHGRRSRSRRAIGVVA